MEGGPRGEGQGTRGVEGGPRRGGVGRLKEEHTEEIRALKIVVGITLGELVNKCSRRWVLGMVGGLVSPGAALRGYLLNDE